MLHIGIHPYEFVRAQSGFCLALERQRHSQSLQRWRLDAHFVPSDADPDPRRDSVWEYLRFTVFPFDFQLPDWRELTRLRLDLDTQGAAATWFMAASIENLLAPRTAEELFAVKAGGFQMQYLGDYLFRCEFDGFVQWRGKEEAIKFIEEIPFTEVFTRVPINATDPVTYAHAKAVKEIGRFEIATGRVLRHDWRREKESTAPLDDGHQVVLSTAWREQVI